ncbi:unnamed protein product [Miscanthus lutarioriparius]|uniref:Uncharacterized protein n=1 Tax=Miscanthus lutarioriparius TaxID=422564 RepID=A0A811RF23_9POAL|nr:unnamed protein product [Miscanthus lutarioriparius]
MESPGEREPQPTPPPASLRPPPSTPPPPSIPATDPPSLTPAASSEQVLEALLGAGDEELLDWGDESPVHIYSQACAGEDAEHPRSGPSSPAPAKLVPIEVPGGSAPAAGGSGGSATAAAMDISICSPPDLRKQGATRAEGAALATAEGSGKAMASSSTTPATQPGANLYCSPDSRWEMGAPAGVIAGQEEPISPKWQHAKAGRRSRAPPVPHPDTAASKPAPRGSPSAAFAAFKKRFAGRCFRCLASDHQVAHCRDPGAEDTEGCTETEDNGDCASFCRKMFRKVPEPLLPRPASPQVVKKQAGQSSTRRRRRTLAPTRSSLRQAARPSPVPVAQRAQLKLMRELDLTSQRRRSRHYVRTAAKMDNKELCKALAAIAAESGGDEIVVP